MKKNHLNKFEKQLYKYDCWAKSVHNILKIITPDNIYDYTNIIKELKTTTIWGTFQKYIGLFLDNKWIQYKISTRDLWLNSYNIILINWNRFYKDNVDYWHYFISYKISKSLHKVYDVWDWKIYNIKETDLINLTKNALVWKSRENDIIYSFT
jgi:hypothetical protein